MPKYSTKNVEHIAAAIGSELCDVIRHRKRSKRQQHGTALTAGDLVACLLPVLSVKPSRLSGLQRSCSDILKLMTIAMQLKDR